MYIASQRTINVQPRSINRLMKLRQQSCLKLLKNVVESFVIHAPREASSLPLSKYIRKNKSF